MRTVRRSKPFLEMMEQRLLMSFSPVLSDPVGAYPQSVVSADFNNDGNSDLATANANDGTLSVLLGDGQPATQLAVGTYPLSLAVANFNNDGIPDLMFNDGLAVGVLLGKGGGAFQAPVTLTNNPPFSAAAAGDFNNDGNSDIVVLINDPEFDYGWALVNVRLGDGHGGFPSFAPQSSIFLTATQYALSTGDLNGDGNLDVITSVGAGNGWGANALLGNGDGTFVYVNQFFTGGDAAVAIADFTGDGFPDLVSAGTDVAIQVGHGDGTFALPISCSANGSMHTGVAVADFNGDGKLDVVTSDADTGTVSLLLGNGNGGLTYTGAYAVGLSPSAITVGDFNGDFWPDVAAANAGSNTVSLLLNDQSWPAVPPVQPSVSLSDATVTEGNTGSVNATFKVSLSIASQVDVVVHYSTANVSATAGSDYQAASGDLIIPAGQLSRTFTVAVKGDRLAEPDETFAINLSGATNATIADGQGIGTIRDNEPRISIGDVTKKEGKKNKTTLFTFTITLSAAYDQPVTMSFKTVDGTARTSDSDYTAKTGTLTFKPGETTKTITIEVKGDSKKEANKTFYLDLFGLSPNSLFTKNRGLGTILNDD